ncbi:PhzF family phenazine biosynthesis isomerase [Nocardia sp. NPDC050710]|uniref:PhzF family phenazine biosynthesis protein n=1 Tax=Nocardia sp. NPDC050710 TaxID=3157220 RepID=UPI0033CDEA17
MEILRYAAFSPTPDGGNPAGVVLDARGIDDATMLATAAAIGFSETAFVTPAADGHLDIRYFSPRDEVPFCGHATIATAVAYADRHGAGELRLRTKAGPVTVATEVDSSGATTATLVAVPPRTVGLPEADLTALLAALRWRAEDLDPALPPRVAYAGAWHPIIAASTRARLADLDYDMAALGRLMREKDWTTIDLVWREDAMIFHARNPFPPGGVVEDPATGAAAAAFGGYLRELDLVPTPATITVHQGRDMGRPGVITVTIPAAADSGIHVTGTAVQL